ncbi:hypothetical protein LMF32_00120 [Desemzia sp. C1]|uniref:hypothetical protein n=1 Tax=Desemzia sp. C1 TaxID=2892016 RepID=UPI001E5DCBD7|nr:hypothetical protein [Desemzia sp. C1]MCI3027541.1 hypothetical protein [Desemzia sp. C1]
MIERFQRNIKVKLSKGDDVEKKNKKRHEAINQHYDDLKIKKDDFLTHIKSNNLHKGKDEVLNHINQIDFSNANPRNHTFMNELSFAGESIAEGFLEVFNIQQNKAIRRYKKQLQVIEREDENGEKKYFIGTFQSDKLKRLTPYKDDKEELAQQLKKQQDQHREQKQEQTIALQREEEK